MVPLLKFSVYLIVTWYNPPYNIECEDLSSQGISETDFQALQKGHTTEENPFNTVPIDRILSVKNVRAWVSMDFT